MSPRRILVLAVPIASVVLAVGWWSACSEPEPPAGSGSESNATTAFVEAVKVGRKTIAETVTAYGSVIAQPGKLQTTSVAYEARVSHVLVAPGQPVEKGDPLLAIAASPSTQLQVNQARSAADLARKELKQTQERFDLKLATNQDLNSAERAATQAALQLASLEREGADTAGLLRAPSEGIVANVAVQDGQLVAGGAALVEIIATDEIEAKIGVEPEDLVAVSVGQSVALLPVNQPASREIGGTVRLVTRRINPATRLVDVYVSLPPDSGLMLDGYLRASIARESKDALVVPRSSVLPKDDAWQLFTVRDGRAVAHRVRLGVVSDGEAEVLGDALEPGDLVVTVGNAELEDGMAVDHLAMNFSDWTHRHSRSLLFLFAVLAAAGAMSSCQLPVSLFPQVSFPRVRIDLEAGDRPAERMVVEVTTPIEEAVRAIPGVRGVRSTTSRGSAQISVNFDWGQDMTSALLQAESEVNKVIPALPPGTSFDAERMDPTVFPVIAYSLTSNARPLTELRDLALYTLRPALTTVTGVSRIGVQGGRVEEFRVVADVAKLQSFGLTLADVAKALSASNVLTAVGRLEENDKLYLVISDTRFKNLEEISRTVLRSTPYGVVLLDDVAAVERSTQPQWIRVTADGRDAVLFQVYQQPGGNTVQIAEGVKAKLAELEKQLPADVRVANWYDQSDLIIASASSTRDAVLVGIALAALVLLVFLRDWKVTFIAILTVPAVLAATILLLSVLGMSFNIMTLGGMAAAVGLIIDDAIVMIEHIVRRVREGGEGGIRERVLAAATEFTRPLVGSSSATIIIFTPLAFLSGVTGAFFKALSLTMASSLVISFFLSLVGVPILAARLLTERDVREEGGRFSGPVPSLYERLMRVLFARPWLVLLFLVPLVGGGVLGFRNGATGFMPVMDEGGFILDYLSPPGTSLSETDRLLRRVEDILRATPDVQTYSRRTGLQLGGGISEANVGDFFVRLVPLPRRPIETIMEDVRTRVERTVPGLQIETAQLMEDLIGDLTSVPQPIEIKLYSNEESVLEQVGPAVAEAISKVDGVIEVKDGIVPAGDALNIEVNRVKAGLEGMDPDAITQAVGDFLGGAVTSGIQRGPKVIGVRVWIPQADRRTEADLGNLLLRAADGHLFPLKRVATLTPVIGQPEITRDDLKRMVAVTGRIAGRDLGSTVAEVKTVLSERGLLPDGVTFSLGGLYEQQQIAFRGLTIILVIAVALVFLLLLFLYETFRVAGAMLVTTLLAVAGVYLGLWVTGTEFNITSRMGMTMIIGIVTEVAIFYYSEYVELPASEERFIRAGANRMRPIAMTTFAAILALAPLALGIGEGSAMLQPLAIAIVSGLVFQLPLVLVVLPVLLQVSSRSPLFLVAASAS